MADTEQELTQADIDAMLAGRGLHAVPRAVVG